MKVYDYVNAKWKQTSSLIFGGEVGELDALAPWLSEGLEITYSAKSALSGKPVAYSSKKYWPDAKWLSFEEIDFGKKFSPLQLDELKDIDSIMQAISDRVYYAGNVTLGNSAFVDASANISDSHYVYHSSESGDSKYLGYTNLSRLCENIFGSSAPGESAYCIRCNDTYRVKRCFELWQSVNSFDCYYVFSVMNCSDCMFSFNLRSKKYAIGNCVLDKDTYVKVKDALLSQMRDELKSKKRLPSLLDIVARCRTNTEEVRQSLAAKIKPAAEASADLAPIDEAFARTTRVLLGQEQKGVKNYAPWLSKNLNRYAKYKSIVSGRSVFVGDYGKYFSIPPERMLKEEEALILAESAKPNQKISQINLDNAHEFIEDAAFFSLDIYAGNNSNIVDCQSYADSKNCLNCFPCVGNSNSAYNFWPRSSDHVFGCSILFDSAFCINCHHSVKLNRCFEVDSSRDCSDSYFCHNCENVRDSMFCFNTKNLRYAIGNTEVGREKYLEVKKRVMDELAKRIATQQSSGLDIFSIS